MVPRPQRFCSIGVWYESSDLRFCVDERLCSVTAARRKAGVLPHAHDVTREKHAKQAMYGVTAAMYGTYCSACDTESRDAIAPSLAKKCNAVGEPRSFVLWPVGLEAACQSQQTRRILVVTQHHGQQLSSCGIKPVCGLSLR